LSCLATVEGERREEDDGLYRPQPSDPKRISTVERRPRRLKIGAREPCECRSGEGSAGRNVVERSDGVGKGLNTGIEEEGRKSGKGKVKWEGKETISSESVICVVKRRKKK
jgi:hypothetical protein